MAEAPDHGLHEALALRVWMDRSGDVRIVGPSFGPAGAIVVELPDGSSWTVDHHDPDRLVSYEPPGPVVDSGSLSGDPVLAALVGGEVAMALGGALDVVSRSEETFDDPVRPPRPRRRGRMPSPMAELLLLVDLIDDPDVPPLARVAAGVEALRRMPPTPGGDLLFPLRGWMVESVVVAADSTERLEVAELDPRLAGDLADLLDGLDGLDAFDVRDGPGRGGADLSHGLRPLLGWLEELDGRDSAIVRSVAEPDLVGAAAAAPTGAPMAPDEGSAEHSELDLDLLAVRDAVPLRVERVSPVLVEVTTTDPSASGRWARVRRSDGLVLIGHAPMRETWDRVRDGGFIATVAVPPDLSDDDMVVAIVDEDEISAVGSAPFEDVRDAIRAGREACREGRLGKVGAARAAWERCAALWAAVGDEDRFRMAAELAELGPAGPQPRPFLADRISASQPASST